VPISPDPEGRGATRSVEIRIDLDAIRSNLCEARRLSAGGRLFAVVKADAYGHGAVRVARALSRKTSGMGARADGFAVVTVNEAKELRTAGIRQPVLVLQGPADEAEAQACLADDLWPVIHDLAQLHWYRRSSVRQKLQAWLKVDTGMGRLGVQPGDVASILGAADGVHWRGVLSHLACADETDSAHASTQIETFRSLDIPARLERSLANSAGIIAWPDARQDWARPGLMLYGIDPRESSRTLSASGPLLRPAMRVSTTLVSVKSLPAGAGIGYAQTWRCPESMPVGLARLGYADGFPRVVDETACVSTGGMACPVVGRVSMDSIAIDLRQVPDATTGDDVEVWGDHLPVDRLASAAGTIAYEMLVGIRGNRRYVGDG